MVWKDSWISANLLTVLRERQETGDYYYRKHLVSQVRNPWDGMAWAPAEYHPAVPTVPADDPVDKDHCVIM